jgi:hypothetical protein
MQRIFHRFLCSSRGPQTTVYRPDTLLEIINCNSWLNIKWHYNIQCIFAMGLMGLIHRKNVIARSDTLLEIINRKNSLTYEFLGIICPTDNVHAFIFNWFINIKSGSGQINNAVPAPFLSCLSRKEFLKRTNSEPVIRIRS